MAEELCIACRQVFAHPCYGERCENCQAEVWYVMGIKGRPPMGQHLREETSPYKKLKDEE